MRLFNRKQIVSVCSLLLAVVLMAICTGDYASMSVKADQTAADIQQEINNLNKEQKDIEKRLEALKKDIAMTAYMGSPYVIIHPFFNMVNRERPSAEEEWELNRDRYSALIPTLKEYNVVCCLENMFVGGPEGMRYAAVCSDFREAAEWIDKLNDIAGEERFGFCMDTGHCHLTGQNMRRALNFIGHRLKTLHIHDNDGHTDWHMGAFMGTTDWELFIEGLRDINYEGDLSFETFKVLDNFPPEMMEICLRMIAESGKYFKQRLGK